MPDLVGREARLVAVASLTARARSAPPGAARRSVVLVDGRSGTGKTTLGDALGTSLGWRVVHLDDVYPGWDGLDAAARAVVDDLLGPPSGYRRWDWARSEPADWVPLDPSAPLVVEGCGALSRGSAPLASLRVWLRADDDVRRRRALDRDGAVFAAEWERWARQEDAFIATEDPEQLADVVLRS
ncbi:ATP-binding protein [Curtobacterium sp. 9128]|uniref:ATP-binding protein n=1 Tax=Curtobacterium sp. 9128 TaxID=1793722 RepID=UPI0021B1620C|nr:ATP-binding protein [Curtobacterium sp. 9128]